MAIKRYLSEADTTITNAFKPDLILRGTGSNMGASDSLEVFSLYGQVTTSSLEKSRILVKFPTTDILADRTAGNLPASGSVKFFLRLFNVQHPFTLPREYYLNVSAVSQSWDEGYGLDMESYSDNGFGMLNGFGCNWEYAQSGVLWSETGSTSFTNTDVSQFFKNGNEDLNVDVTSVVEQWISGSLVNNGFLIKMSGSFEDGSRRESFYTKKFSARGTEYFYSRPVIEALWDSSLRDDRSNFYVTSSLLSDEDNTQYLYFYNRPNGTYKNIAGVPSLSIKFYTDLQKTNEVSAAYAAVTNPSVGLYKAEVRLHTTASQIYDFWSNSTASSITYFSGSIGVKEYTANDTYIDSEYIINLTNLRSKYSPNENTVINVYSRLKNWSPTNYTVSSENIETKTIKNLYYKIFRIEDNKTIFDYSTGSIAYTKTSYDKNGNNFKIDMRLLEPDFAYGIKLSIYDGNELKEFKQVFKFRVDDK